MFSGFFAAKPVIVLWLATSFDFQAGNGGLSKCRLVLICRSAAAIKAMINLPNHVAIMIAPWRSWPTLIAM